MVRVRQAVMTPQNDFSTEFEAWVVSRSDT